MKLSKAEIARAQMEDMTMEAAAKQVGRKLVKREQGDVEQSPHQAANDDRQFQAFLH